MDAEIYTLLTTDSMEPFKTSQKYVKEYYARIFKKQTKVVSESRLVWVEENGKRTLQMKLLEIVKEIPYEKDMAVYRECISFIKSTVRGQLQKVFKNHYFLISEIETLWDTKIKMLSKWVEMNFSVMDSLRGESDIPIDEIVPSEFYKECILPNLLDMTKSTKYISNFMFHKWMRFLNQSYFVWNDKYYETIHQFLEPFFQEEYQKLRNSQTVYVAYERLKSWTDLCDIIRSERAKEDIMKHVVKHVWDEHFENVFARTLLKHNYYPSPNVNILDKLLSVAPAATRTNQMERFKKSFIEELKSLDIHQILTLHTYYKNYSRVEFKENTNRYLFNIAIQNAYKFILKEDVLENFVKFLDLVIRKPNIYESMELLKQSTDIISYIADKDMFMELYQNYMTRRLLSTMEKDDTYKQLEEYMISYLKMNHGSNMIYRIETMYNDLIKKAQLVLGNTTLRTLNFAACNTEAITSVPGWKIPKQLEHLTNAMKTTLGNERVLTWIPAHDSITLQTTFNNKQHSLTMTSIQASVLFLFDSLKKQSFTKEEIAEHIGLSDPAAILHSLTSTRVPLLICEDSQYRLVDTLNTQLYHVIIPPPPTLVKKKEIAEKVEMNRDYSIDAVIVRIMKSRKQMKFTELQVEVVKQLSNIFQATTQQIKKRMESLIDKDYIERDEKDVSLLKYVA